MGVAAVALSDDEESGLEHPIRLIAAKAPTPNPVCLMSSLRVILFMPSP
ncbi:hypothetical protein AB3538_13350 [Acinetobacter baumannii]